MAMLFTSVGRTLDILEYLARTSAAGVSEIARDLGLDKSIVSRQLAYLGERLYVERDAVNGKFQLGYRLLALAATVEERRDLRHVALPAMRRLRDQTGETVALFLRNRQHMVCVEQVPGRELMRLVFSLGEAIRLWPSGSPGRVLLAWAPETELQQFFASLEGEAAKAAGLAAELVTVRERGYATGWGERTPGAVGISAPIFDFRGHCVGAISLALPMQRFSAADEQTLAAQVKHTAAVVARCLGNVEGAK